MSEITSRHDSFFRQILSDKNVAVDYLKNYLPTSISEKLDFSTLAQTGDTYISKQLRKTFSDIVFTCQKNTGKESATVSILIEHKSRPDKYTPLQIGSYIFSGLLKQIANGQKLTIIIPVLFYHGNEKWKYVSVKNLFEDLEPEWEKFLPDFDYVYNNLWDRSDKEIEALSNQFLIAALLTMKHSREKEWLNENAVSILARSKDTNGNLLESLFVYFFTNSEADEPKIIKLVESLPDTVKSKIMNTMEIFIEKGIRQGAEKEKYALTKNLLKEKSFSINDIARLVGVDINFVEKVKSEIEL